MSYTEKKHAANLLKMLEKDDPCKACPDPSACCDMCGYFIGMQPNGSPSKCPCDVLGPKEAKKRTWIALEEKGYTESCTEKQKI